MGLQAIEKERQSTAIDEQSSALINQINNMNLNKSKKKQNLVPK